MFKTLTIAALVLAPAMSHAQQGWGNLSGCERIAGVMESSDDVFILWPDRIERWESTCQVTGFDGDINGRSLIETTCTGEGETWAQSYGMTPVGDLYVIWPIEYPDATFELRACP